MTVSYRERVRVRVVAAGSDPGVGETPSESSRHEYCHRPSGYDVVEREFEALSERAWVGAWIHGTLGRSLGECIQDETVPVAHWPVAQHTEYPSPTNQLRSR